MVAAFTGWNDAGDAASDSVGWLRTHSGAEPFASIDPDEHYDFQAHRPEVRITDGVTREISWPTLEFAAASASGDGPGLVLLTGPEPNLRWRGFCDTVIEVARETGCGTVVTFGALLADTPHTAPIRVSGSPRPTPRRWRGSASSRPATRGRRASSGCSTTHAATRASRRASFWAPVPHYVATPPNPPATRALLERFAAFTEHPLDLRELRSQPTRGEHGSTARSRTTRRCASTSAGSRSSSRIARRPVPKRRRARRTSRAARTSREAFEDYLREQGRMSAVSRNAGRRTPRRSRARARSRGSRLSWSTRSSLPWNIVA